MTIKAIDTKSLTTGTLTNLKDRATAETEITKLDTAIQKIADERNNFRFSIKPF